MTHPVMLVGTDAITASRFAPAIVRGQQIMIQCPSFCTVDHVTDSTGHIEDIWHASDSVDLNVPRLGRQPELMAFAKIQLDGYSSDPAKRTPFINVEDSSADGFDMAPAQALVYADNLEAFAARIRAMARTAAAVAR
ncbi:hypothetical protein OS965_02310 [Streptomyces sp. H27-G5]|uniref:DUF6907 domain-containing protein n=1 Tax=Streptomyces sp. H27-G5 TaxID=2996698 RepID=UPI00226E63B8|nr:hypothetical protein [Streptomyces sp. H27-G5]MCY0917009.1 hypothetical protein [Streptomyces sp. H27-G5]